jgi:hypothetical protein
MRILLLLWGSILLSVAQLCAQPAAQAVVNATGYTYTGGFYQIDWSVGEVALINEMRASNGQYVITNGFLQSTDGGVSNPSRRFSDDEIRVLPNITDDKVEVSLFTRQQGKLVLQVFDANGRVVFQKKLVSYGTASLERIALRSLAAGTYFLKIDLVPAPGSISKTGSYKIVKY